MPDTLYSIRMRASLHEAHVSGAERIVGAEKVGDAVHELAVRAMGKGMTPDRIEVCVDKVDDATLRTLTALDVVTLNAPDVQSARLTAVRVLEKAGVSANAAAAGISSLGSGPGPSGKIMRGAAIMDARSGKRLEKNRERGVRASRFDWSEAASTEIDRLFAPHGLTHFRTKEALALATKVAHAPGVVAELCWSDDPDYTAGYVASLRTGYIRFPLLKERGEPKGGRIFFVDRRTLDLDALAHYLETEAVLITGPGKCRAAVEPEIFFHQS